MSVTIDVDDEAWGALTGLEEQTRRAVAMVYATLGMAPARFETAILFSGDAQVAKLNGQWRGKPVSTNVLSFPAPENQPVPKGEPRPLGDIVLAHGVCAREAAEQGKTLNAHASHLMIHGLLHLLGYDHVDEAGANEMEGLERDMMKGLGFPDPYERP